jgi:uncharacterized protein YcnI
MNRISRTTMLIGATAVAAVALWGAPASAHVSVNPGEATQGGFTKLTFRVPNEKESGATTRLEIALLTDTPLGFVSTRPTAGWTAVVTKEKLDKPIKTDDGEVTEAVARITWTADEGNGIPPGQFQEFDISAGPLPTAEKMVFKALQTYSDGEVVRWIDEGENAEHPAPTLTLTKAAAGDEGGHHGGATAAEETSSDNGTAIGLGIGGLVAGLAGLVLGGLAFARTRRTPPAPAADRARESVSS